MIPGRRQPRSAVTLAWRPATPERRLADRQRPPDQRYHHPHCEAPANSGSGGGSEVMTELKFSHPHLQGFEPALPIGPLRCLGDRLHQVVAEVVPAKVVLVG